MVFLEQRDSDSAVARHEHLPEHVKEGKNGRECQDCGVYSEGRKTAEEERHQQTCRLPYREPEMACPPNVVAFGCELHLS